MMLCMSEGAMMRDAMMIITVMYDGVDIATANERWRG